MGNEIQDNKRRMGINARKEIMSMDTLTRSLVLIMEAMNNNIININKKISDMETKISNLLDCSTEEESETLEQFKTNIKIPCFKVISEFGDSRLFIGGN